MTTAEIQAMCIERDASITVKTLPGRKTVYSVMIIGIRHTGACASEDLGDAVKTAFNNYDELV